MGIIPVTLIGQIQFPTFLDHTGIVFVGSAYPSDSVIQLNDSIPKTAGGIWFAVKQPVARGFTTSFDFQIVDTAGQGDASGLRGGDGLAFVIQNDSPAPLGGSGGQLGYDPIRNSLAIEFDTYKNNEPGFFDPSSNHISIQCGGTGTNSASHSFAIATNSTYVPPLSDGRIHRVTITYVDGVMRVYLDGCQGLMLSVPLDLARRIALDSGRAWVGVTAATGSAWEEHILRSWSFNGRPLAQSERVAICEGAAATLRPPGNFRSYRWSTGATTPSISVTKTGSYTVVVVDTIGCEPVDVTWRFDVTASPLPKPRIVPTDPGVICSGKPVTLDAGDYALYRWSTGEVTRTISATQPGRYWVDVTTSVGCSARSDTITIAAGKDPVPNVTISGPTTFCEGDSLVLDAGPGFASYRWSSGERTRSIVARTSGRYTVTVTSEQGCAGVSAGITVLVIPRPYPVIEVVGGVHVCEGGSTTLRTASGFRSYRWSTGDTTPSITVARSGEYWVDVSNASGCHARSAPVTVFVHPLPVPEIVADTLQRLCADDSVVLRTRLPYASVRWSTGETTPAIAITRSMTVSVAVVDSFGCVGESGPFDQQIEPVGPLQIRIDGAREICEGDSVVLSAPAGLASYRWSTGDTVRTIVVRQTQTVRIVARDALGCEAEDSVSVVVHSVPAASAGEDLILCAGTSAKLRASGGSTYRWWPSDGLSCSDCAEPIASPVTTTRYFVEVSNGGACVDTASLVVAVAPAPHAGASVASAHAYPGVPVDLPVVLSGAIDEAAADAFTLDVTYDPGVIRLQGVVLAPDLLSGWHITTQLDTAGQFRARLASESGQTLGEGSRLLDLRFATFLGWPVTANVTASITLEDRPCAVVTAGKGTVTIDSVCGVRSRLIEALDGTYALRSTSGYPSSDVVDIILSMPADGTARVRLVNQAGTAVRTLHAGSLSGGDHRFPLSTRDLPSGIYFCQAASGEWVGSIRLAIVK